MSKLQKLLGSIPKNAVILDNLLNQNGISNSLKQKYLKSGTILILSLYL